MNLFEVQDLAELRDVLVVMPGMPLFGFWTDWWNHGREAPQGAYVLPP
ncbi:hypothetical protein NKH18_46350 [Streptomyces sp. M10(2022)]